MPRVRCPRCKGSGDEPPNLLLTVLTLGTWWLIDSSSFPDKCHRCDGIGYVAQARQRPY